MASCKWLSIGISVISAAVCGVLLAYVQWSGHTILGSTSADAVLIAVTTGFAVGLTHWAAASRHQNELHRVLSYVESLGRTDGRPTPFNVPTSFKTLLGAFEHTVNRLRKRIEQLISQRRELEVQLRISDSERRHAEAIINSISDAVVATDAFNEIVMANAAAARVLGFELEQALHRPIDKVTDDGTLVRLIKDAREYGRVSMPRHAEHQIRRGGESAMYDVSLACMPGSNAGRRDETEETAGVVTILRDVTREREIAEMKSEFVSNVSHELRTPLSSIKAYMEMLVDGEADDEQTRAEFYNIIQGETNRLQRLIDNILNISRIESGVVKVQREHVALKGLLHETIDVMQPQARAKQIELTADMTPTFFQVLADKDMIYQITLNLLGNAIKYTMPKGKVTLKVEVDEIARLVTVAVVDTGVGIPDEDIPHLFDKFYRVADHKKLAKGTGLGLNLVKHIVETVHGGHVSVTSEVGVGSTFSYKLSIAEDALR